MKIKYNMVITPKSGRGREENLPIRIRITFNGSRVEFGTGYSIDSAKWDYGKQRVKNGCTNKFKQTSSQINADLAKLEAKIDEIFRAFELQGISPTADLFKSAFQGNSKSANKKVASGMESQQAETAKVPPSIWEVFDIFVRESGRMNDWTESTYAKFAAAKKHLKDFDEEITFEAFTENRLNDYVLFLRHKKKHRNSTIMHWERREHSGYMREYASSDSCSSGVVYPKRKETDLQFRIKKISTIPLLVENDQWFSL